MLKLVTVISILCLINSVACGNVCAKNPSLCDRPGSGHHCIDTEDGDYECTCKEGYINYDAKTCVDERHNDTAKVLHTTGDGKVYYHDIDQQERILVDEVPTNPNPGVTKSVDFDYENNYATWLNILPNGTTSVRGVKLDPDRPSFFDDGVELPSNLPIDPSILAYNCPYHLNYLTNQIIVPGLYPNQYNVFDLRTGYMINSLEFYTPSIYPLFTINTMLLVPNQNLVFYTFGHEQRSFGLMRTCLINLSNPLNPDSSNVVLGSARQIYTPRYQDRYIVAATVDNFANNLYLLNYIEPLDLGYHHYHDSYLMKLTAMDFSGRVLNSFPLQIINANHPAYMAPQHWLYNDHIFSVFGDNILINADGSIHRINKHGLDNSTQVISNPGKIDISQKLVHPSLQPSKPKNKINYYC